MVLFIKAVNDSYGDIRLVDYAIAAALVAIAVSIYFAAGNPIRDFLRETKKGQIDEKIAMLYGYILSIPDWKDAKDVVKQRYTKKISADIRAIGKIRGSMEPGQKEDLFEAKKELMKEMNSSGLSNEADQLDTVFRTWIW